jgi:hypothetical protein
MSAHNDIPVKENGNVTALVSLPGGGMAFATAGPAWGVISSNGTVTFRQQTPGALADSTLPSSWPRNLRLSSDGHQVSFQYGSARTAAVFDLAKRNWISEKTDLASPIVSGSGVDVQSTSWLGSRKKAPTLNGKALQFDPGELTTSLAIASDGQFVALGSIFSVRLFNRDGNMIWRNLLSVSDVNISADGKWVVAESRDGTLRWYHLADGKEVLALYPQPDSHDWVMWTPSGYFDASPGSENLIGWHINRGPDQAADFFPASQFRERFYRPDVINRIVDTLDEAKAVAQANAAAGRREPTISVAEILPPVVEIVSAPERFAATTIPIRIKVRAPPDAPVMRLRVLVNGEIMPSPRAAEPVNADGSQELTLVLPPKDSEIKIYADNRNSTSLPRTLTLQWAGERKVFAAGEQGTRKAQKPKLWVLAVGVSAYRDPSVPRLSYADADADAFARMLKAQQGKAYRDVEMKVLTDAQATRASVLAGLDWIRSQVGAGDVGMVFLAGHGFTMATDHQYYYGAVDVDLKRLTDTGVPYKAIQDALIDFNLRGNGTRAVFFIDTCHAGDASGARLNATVKASNGDALVGELTRFENQVLVFASSKAEQSSWEEPEFKHGAFTEALVEGLGDQWQADPRATGRVTYKNLDAWISDRVPVITHDRQTPRLMTPPGGVDDFVLGMK